MPIISAEHRYSETELALRPWAGGWRIEAGWWGFDARGEKEHYTEWVGDTYTDEAEARHVLAQLRGA